MTRLWPEGEAVEAWGDKRTLSGFVWKGASHQILQICNRSRRASMDSSTEETIWREDIKVKTDGGLLCLLYRDLYEACWFLTRVYD